MGSWATIVLQPLPKEILKRSNIVKSGITLPMTLAIPNTQLHCHLFDVMTTEAKYQVLIL